MPLNCSFDDKYYNTKYRKNTEDNMQIDIGGEICLADRFGKSRIGYALACPVDK